MAAPYRYRARGTFYLIMISVFAAVAFAAVLFARGYSIDPKTGIVAKTALLVLASTPSSAEVRINGEPRREKTTARIKVAPGRYDITIDKPGVIPYQKTVTVSSGTAVLEEDILLFLKEPKTRELAQGGASVPTLSNNGREVFYVLAEPAGSAVWRAQLNGSAAPKRITALPLDFGTPARLSVSSDASRLALSNERLTAVITVGSGEISTLALPDAAFAGTRNDTLLTRIAGQPVVVDIQTARQTSLPPASTVTTSGNAVYSAVNQTITRTDIQSGATSIVTAPAPIATLSTNAVSQSVYAQTTDQRLFQIVSDTLLPIDSRVVRFDPSFDDSVVVTGDESELRIWRRETGKVSLITRFSNSPTVFRVHKNGGYVYFERGSELHAIATDGANDVVLGSLGTRSLLTDSYMYVRLQDGRLDEILLLES